MEGKYTKIGKASNTVMKIFFKKNERDKLLKVSYGGHDKKSIKPIWVDMVVSLMRYFTLDGIFSAIFGYHFILLNHFRHKKLVYFPYYLLLSGK